jgi:uncharacterized membrane protein
MKNLHDLLQLVAPLFCVLIACGNQWLLELFKLKKQKAGVSIDTQEAESNKSREKVKRWDFIFNCVRILGVVFAVLQIYFFVNQSAPLSNKNIFFISYDMGFIILLIVMFFIDRLQNNVISLGSSIINVAASLRLYAEKKENLSPEASKAIKEILNQLESAKSKKSK